MKKHLTTTFAVLVLLSATLSAAKKVYNMERFGIKSNTKQNCSVLMKAALEEIARDASPKDKIVLQFSLGQYDFYPEGATEREYYISNHDQVNPKKVGIALEDFNNLTLEGNGASFVFHGRMLPISLLRSKNCVLKDFSIDFDKPQIAQIQIIENDPQNGITFLVAPWVNYRINSDSVFETYGEGWKNQQNTGIAFEKGTRHLVYNTSDLSYSTKGIYETKHRKLTAPLWKDSRLTSGTIVAMRTWERPAPGIFLSHNVDTKLENVKVHYSEGMGLLAQLCDNITLDGFGVCLKGSRDPRYFTTQADATHFSGCKGKIISINGLYEGMMDDAINIHGTYLKVIKRLDNNTLIGRYMHGQSWGFDWGFAGDKVQFVRSKTMELIGKENKIVAIQAIDKPTSHGAKEFRITFAQDIDPVINESDGFGIENLTWAPEVLFANNIIRNNRARGSLFSTPRKTVVENNFFDHTSGTAILLCGDCNGWYETGACREVIIRKNKFVNALTNMFQFTNAIISIYPEIPNLKDQVKYFHGGKKGAILIENNEFETFDAPILYAKSVNGLVFRKNKIIQNTDYKPFHWNKKRFLLERVINAEIEEP